MIDEPEVTPFPTDERGLVDAPPAIHMPSAQPPRRRRSFGRAAAVMALIGCALGVIVGTTVSISVGSAGREVPPPPAPEPRPAPSPEDRAAARAGLRRQALQRAMDAAPAPPEPAPEPALAPEPAPAPTRRSGKGRVRVPLSEVSWVRSGTAEAPGPEGDVAPAEGVADDDDGWPFAAPASAPASIPLEIPLPPLRSPPSAPPAPGPVGQIRLRAVGLGALVDGVPTGTAQATIAADPQVALVRARIALHERVAVVARTELGLGAPPVPGVGLVAVPVLGRRWALAVGLEAAVPPPGDLAADASLRGLAAVGPLEVGLGGLVRVSAAGVAPAGLLSVDWPLGWITPMGELGASPAGAEGSLGLAVDPAAAWQLAAWWTWRGGPGFRLGVTWTLPEPARDGVSAR